MIEFQVFEESSRRDHEQVIFCRDEVSGLRAIIGIHNTSLGPALGGCRMYPYATERDALVDVLRLSRGMTYKAAVSGLNLGGGKCVVIGDPKKDKSELLWRALGRFIEGRYYIDFDWIKRFLPLKLDDGALSEEEFRSAVNGLP